MSYADIARTVAEIHHGELADFQLDEVELDGLWDATVTATVVPRAVVDQIDVSIVRAID